MKTIAIKSIGSAVLIFTLIAFTGCEEQTATLDDISADTMTTGTDSLETDSTETDIYGTLKFMREEEKLAHDVYVNLFDTWGEKVFGNISKSETKHTDAIKGLLDYYGIEDPVLPDAGKFSNQDLQKLYDDLMANGNISLIEALKVGATIEEVDIIDLDKAIKECDKDTIKTVYGRLRTGSTHHLKAFVANLSKQGINYTPQFLTQEMYDEIMNSTDSLDGHGDGECIDSTNIGTINETEAEGLLWMREEEKLAHDAYVTMYDLWGLRIFDNISKSETQHAESVLNLINLYGLEDPALPNVGEFSNKDLQDLYDKLIVQGKESMIAGLLVGATIEEVDILDLEERMEQTENENILRVYESLEKGSENHLRAFVKQLNAQGYDYTPQYLPQEDFDEIFNN